MLNILHTDERGTTMVELLIASFLTVLVAGAAMQFYITQHKAWMIETEVSEIQQNARAALDEIAGRMKMGGYQVGVHPAFEVGNDSVVVYYRNDSTSHIDTVAYYVDASTPSTPWLMRRWNGDTPEPFAENVESLTMSILSGRLLELSLVARANRSDSTIIDGDGYRRRTLSTQIRVRNL
jgi:hypothetical protein